jgi:hypothetical protein
MTTGYYCIPDLGRSVASPPKPVLRGPSSSISFTVSFWRQCLCSNKDSVDHKGRCKSLESDNLPIVAKTGFEPSFRFSLMVVCHEFCSAHFRFSCSSKIKHTVENLDIFFRAERESSSLNEDYKKI